MSAVSLKVIRFEMSIENESFEIDQTILLEAFEDASHPSAGCDENERSLARIRRDRDRNDVGPFRILSVEEFRGCRRLAAARRRVFIWSEVRS